MSEDTRSTTEAGAAWAEQQRALAAGEADEHRARVRDDVEWEAGR